MVGKMSVVLGLLVVTAGARATPYWVDWEGSDFPENQGWTRVWGNWDGQYQGPGANRTLANGILTYDSLYDDGVYDFSEITRPGQIDPRPGELFSMEWGLKVETVVGYPTVGDPAVSLSSDAAWCLGFEFTVDHIRSIFENYLNIAFAPGVFHAYRVTSTDMQSYDLYIDGSLAHHGTLSHRFGASRVAWGDGVQGEASVHDWDYFRFGVIPEPPTVCIAVVAMGVYCVGRRR